MTKYRRTDPEISRRRFVNYALGATAGVSALSFVTIIGSARPLTLATPDRLPPNTGDVLVYAEGASTGEPIDPDVVESNPTRAWPMGVTEDGETVVKSGDPNNLLLVMKFTPQEFELPTNPEAVASGIVVYSAICTHLGCQVGWRGQDQTLLCPCHSGVYAPKRGAVVIGGPPPKPLPQLPIAVEEGRLVVTGCFLSTPYLVKQDEYEEYVERCREAEI